MTAADLASGPRRTSAGVRGWMTLAEHERDYIRRVVAECNGKIAGPFGAAERLGLPATTLRSRMQKLGLTPVVRKSG